MSQAWRWLALVCVWALCLGVAEPAGAWTRAGHMVSGAIAYDDLAAHDPKVINAIVELMSHHPERGPFEVAVGRATGTERTRRLFMEMARWSDDVRGGEWDHPTWHAAFRPFVDPRDPPPKGPSDAVVYDAFEALALNVHVAADRRAPASERAVALCWIFHVVGDIHQPLHTAELYSAQFPGGDRYGSLEYVLDPKTGQPENLHWFWDDLVWQDDEPAGVAQRARELAAALPRATFASELAGDEGHPADIKAWAAESYAIAASTAYGPGAPTAAKPADAKALPAAYVAAARDAAQRRLTLAGYRLSTLLQQIFDET